MSRLGGNSPLGVPRCNYEETSLLGFRIPKRSTVFMNSWAALRDPKYFEEPLIFRPERFIQNGKLVLPPQLQVLFSMGEGAQFCCAISHNSKTAVDICLTGLCVISQTGILIRLFQGNVSVQGRIWLKKWRSLFLRISYRSFASEVLAAIRCLH